MKRVLFAFLLLLNCIPLYARDEDGDPGYIPNYQELVREGYAPPRYERYYGHDRSYGDDGYFRDRRDDYYLRLGYGLTAQPKPTQAYYGKGYTIYYGYTSVLVPQGQSNALYAFGHSLEYYRRMLPQSLNGVDLSKYAVEVPNGSGNGTYGPGDYVAQRRENRANAVTTVQTVKTTTTTTTAGTNPLPAIGEKPAH